MNVGHKNFNYFLHQSKHCSHSFIFFLQSFPKFNKHRTFNRLNKSKINKPRAYLYSGLKSILLAQITQYYGFFYIYGHFPIQYIFYGHFTLWTFSDSPNLYGHFITMDNLPYGFFTHRSIN